MQFEKEFDDKDLEKIRNMAAIGLPQPTIAKIMGISESTLERMIKHRDALREALEAGRAAGELNFYKTAYQMATSGEYPKFAEFYAQVHYGWRKTQHIHFSAGGGGDKAIEQMSPSEREERIKKLLDVRTKILNTGIDVIDIEAIDYDDEDDEGEKIK